MTLLNQLVEFLDSELKTATISDYPSALNGLQLANEGQVTRVVAAVDASLPVIEAVAAGGPALLIVHHGIFWQGAQPLTGAFYRKIKTAMDAGLAIYSSHLPLDVHPEFGNNVLLARAIGLQDITPFFERNGLLIGIKGKWHGTRNQLAATLRGCLQDDVHVCPGGPDAVVQVGIITGGAGSEVVEVASMGLDSFVTGEGPHWTYPLAEELGLNVFYGGHYATEIFGVKAISEALSKQFGVPWSFYDRPTGL